MTTKNDYFKTFCTLSQAFGTAASIDELLELIVRTAADTMGGKAACLFLADEQRDLFVPKARVGLSDQYIHASPIKAQRVNQALAQKGYLIFEDAATDSRLENRDAKIAEGIASIMTVGVVVEDKQIGVLSIYTAEPCNFSDDDIVFLKALAANGGIALQKAMLLERIEKNASLFLELSSSINSSIEISEVLSSLTEKTATAMEMKGASIQLHDEDANTLNVVATYGLSKGFLNKGYIDAEGGISSDSLKGKTVVVEDISKDKRLQYPEETWAEGIRSLIALPIQSKDKTIGVLKLYGDKARRYSKHFLDVLQAVANSGALAIQNASMYLALKEDKKDLEEDVWSHRMYF